jgi:hypothetical protein
MCSVKYIAILQYSEGQVDDTETNFYINSARTSLSQTSHQKLHLHPPFDVLNTESLQLMLSGFASI